MENEQLDQLLTEIKSKPHFIAPELTEAELQDCLTAYQSTGALCMFIYTYADKIDDDEIYNHEGYSVKYMIFHSLKTLIVNWFSGGNNKMEFLDAWHVYRVDTDGLEDNEIEIEILKDYPVRIGQLTDREREKYSFLYCKLSELRENILALVRLLLYVEEDIVSRTKQEIELEPVCDMVTDWKYTLTLVEMNLWHITELILPYYNRSWKAREEFEQSQEICKAERKRSGR